jgi:hypothetical protein
LPFAHPHLRLAYENCGGWIDCRDTSGAYKTWIDRNYGFRVAVQNMGILVLKRIIRGSWVGSIDANRGLESTSYAAQ